MFVYLLDFFQFSDNLYKLYYNFFISSGEEIKVCFIHRGRSSPKRSHEQTVKLNQTSRGSL